MPALADVPGETLGEILKYDDCYCDWEFDMDVMSYDKLNKFLVFREGCEERYHKKLVDRVRKVAVMSGWKDALQTRRMEERQAAWNRIQARWNRDIGIHVFRGRGWTCAWPHT